MEDPSSGSRQFRQNRSHMLPELVLWIERLKRRSVSAVRAMQEGRA